MQITSLSLGSDGGSRIRVSWLEQQQPRFRGNPAVSPGTVWITLARCCPGNQVFVFCNGSSARWQFPSLGTGRWPGWWPKPFWDPEKKKRPQSLETLVNDFPCRGNARCFVLFLGTFPGLLRLAWWEMLPGARLLQGIPKDPVSPVWDKEPLLFLAGNRIYLEWGGEKDSTWHLIMTAET